MNTADEAPAVVLDEREHIYQLFFEDIPMCGCGDPESVYELVRGVLSLAPFHQNAQAVRDLIGGNGDGPYYLTLYVLDKAGLIEHGGGIGGSWLTQKGEHYLSLMKRHEWADIDGCDDNDECIPVGVPHDGKGCPEDCAHVLSGE